MQTIICTNNLRRACEEFKRNFVIKQGVEREDAVIRAVAVTRCGGEEQFAEALRVGDVLRMTKELPNGSTKDFFVFPSLTAETITGGESSTVVKSDKSVTAAQAESFKQALQKEYSAFEFECDAVPVNKPLAIADRERDADGVTLKAVLKLQEAHVVLESAEKDATKIMKELESDAVTLTEGSANACATPT